MLRNMRIGARLILVGIIILAVPLFIVAHVAQMEAGKGLNALTDQQLASRAGEMAQIIDRVYGEEVKLATSMAHNPAIIAAASARAERVQNPQGEAPKNRAAARAAAAAQAASDARGGQKKLAAL